MDINSIQKDLKKKNINACLFMHGNLFINEDILEDENQILKLTNFSGSYAILLILQTKSYLFVDGRYELQAKNEVNTKKIEIIKLSKISLIDWLKSNFPKTSSILYNPWEISLSQLANLQINLPLIDFIENVNGTKNLSPNIAKTFQHHKKFNLLSSKEKQQKVIKYLKKKKLTSYLITSPSNVSWLLNLRSNALPYSPIFRGYALLNIDGSMKVFADNTDLKTALPIDSLKKELANIKKLGLDFHTTPSIIKSFSDSFINVPDIIDNLKSIKDKTELKGIIEAHIRDGVAVSKFIYWLEKNYHNQTELDIKDKLLSYRKKEKNFYSESFATISAYGPNGAIVHYNPTKKTNLTLKKGSLLLLDSGGQYYDGTTDITRTIAIGKPTDEMIEKATLVLKSHIALASSLFPENTFGSELDLIARQPLLKHNLDYLHGTGHGVGYFSNVHEGPHRISIYAKKSASLQKNMITSIEPGFYKENSFGIRIENLYYIKEKKNTSLLSFEPLTLVPIDKTLINKYLLTKDEETWINTYHKQVFNTLKKYLTKQELIWLKEKTSPL